MKANRISIEITRQCDMQPVCSHCFRGFPQNVKLNRACISTLLNRVYSINNLIFTGGEPLLAIDTMQHTLDIIKRRLIKVREFSLITNGLAASTDFFRLVREMDRYGRSLPIKRDGPAVTIGVSLDAFHKNSQEEVFETIAKLQESLNRKTIYVLPRIAGGNPINKGLASNLSSLTTVQYHKSKTSDAPIQFTEGRIETPLYLSARGLLYNENAVNMLPYTEMDALPAICDMHDNPDIAAAIEAYNQNRASDDPALAENYDPTLADVYRDLVDAFLDLTVSVGWTGQWYGIPESERRLAQDDLRGILRYHTPDTNLYVSLMIWHLADRTMPAPGTSKYLEKRAAILEHIADTFPEGSAA